MLLSSWNENVIKYHPVSHELSSMSSDPCTVIMSSSSNYYIFAVIVENKGSFSLFDNFHSLLLFSKYLFNKVIVISFLINTHKNSVDN